MKCTLSQDEIKNVKALGFLHNKNTNEFSGRIITTNGKITSRQNIHISKAAEIFGKSLVTFTSRLTVEVPGIAYDQIQPFRDYLAQEGLATGGTGAKIRPVVSCKGTTCTFGLCDTFALSEKIHHQFFEGYGNVSLPHKFKIAVGGCPNNCAKPDLNDLGIVGQFKPVCDQSLCAVCKKCLVEKICPVNAAKLSGDKMTIDETICIKCGLCRSACHFKAVDGGQAGYKIYVGGRWGKRWSKGHELNLFIESEQEAMKMVEKSILLFKEQGQTGERFSATIERLGIKKVETILCSDELLERKEEIIGN